MINRWAFAAVTIMLAGLALVFALSWQSPISAIAPPKEDTFTAGLVDQGRILAAAGNCGACHSGGHGTLAGGNAFPTGYGTVFAPNITPDVGTGIGAWSQPAFARALREGVARDGSHLFPVFPYNHYTKLTDKDVAALYAYLMTRPAISYVAPSDTIPFPLNIRALQAGWKWAYFSEGRYRPDASRSAEWNRGAYLSEGLTHCGGCHTPRGKLGNEQASAAYGGSAIDGWDAPALTAANTSPLAWSAPALFNYLRTSTDARRGGASGPMSGVIHDGLAVLPDADIRAISVYFADLNGSDAHAGKDTAALARASVAAIAPQSNDADARLYAASCGACHYVGATPPTLARPDLTLNTALWLPAPTNLLHAIRGGVGLHEATPGLLMPGYASALPDADIVRIAAWLRRTRTTLPPWPDLAGDVARARQQESEPQ
ncbi:c-type cytochrome [Polymorphobacter arshaanensis]|uniref:C-type cytochrome n=1 Tax=Glacieibacterium arshaanense TaxID=2511025 RepID=A0A4Y9EQJ8_9SPHN|nr:cytochrome c [Polymorphobacter arshaanensis]TFU05864.1 c-type cytochrome [Polymorphobacter arshaanensis]